MNNYFATVEEKYNPRLRNIPFAVCGDPEMRHNIVMAKNSLAKSFGVLTGLSFYQAKNLCPNLKSVRANMPRYLNETRAARLIYMKYTDTIIPYGLDEAWIDLSQTGASIEDARQIADLIRIEIKYSQGLSASVGVSDNLIFSKLASDIANSNSTLVITRDNYKEIVWPLPASKLLFVGEKRSYVLERLGIYTIGDIANAKPQVLIRALGKVGRDIWAFANGNDAGFHPKNDTIASIGNTITPPKDLYTTDEASKIIYLISKSIGLRLSKHQMKATSISITLKDNKFNTITRQKSFEATNSIEGLFNRAYELFVKHYNWQRPLRSIGVRVSNLHTSYIDQLSLLPKEDICIDIDKDMKNMGLRFEESVFSKENF